MSIYVCVCMCMYDVCTGNITLEEVWNSMQELGYEFSRAEVRVCVVFFYRVYICMYVFVYVCM